MPTFSSQPTPNPDSLKITGQGVRFLDAGLESFSSKQDAEGHALGERLFAIPEVANVFIMPDFLTVTKTPAASWNVVWPKLEEALSQHFAG